MTKTFNLINIGFPLYLVLFEVLLRSFSSVNTSTFIGPTLAASGIGLLIGTLKPKKIEIDPSLLQQLTIKGQSAEIRDPKDERIITICWIVILLELLIWYWSCAVTIKAGDNPTAFNYQPLLLGIVNYIGGIILSTIKGNE